MSTPKRDGRSDDYSMSDRQIAYSVRFGRKVTFWIVEHDEICGYVAGMDKFNYFVLVPGDDPLLPVEKFLVHKGSTPLIELHPDTTYDSEPDAIRDQLRKIISPFRNVIMSNFFPDVLRGTDSSQSPDEL